MPQSDRLWHSIVSPAWYIFYYWLQLRCSHQYHHLLHLLAAGFHTIESSQATPPSTLPSADYAYQAPLSNYRLTPYSLPLLQVHRQVGGEGAAPICLHFCAQ